MAKRYPQFRSGDPVRMIAGRTPRKGVYAGGKPGELVDVKWAGTSTRKVVHIKQIVYDGSPFR